MQCLIKRSYVRRRPRTGDGRRVLGGVIYFPHAWVGQQVVIMPRIVFARMWNMARKNKTTLIAVNRRIQKGLKAQS